MALEVKTVLQAQRTQFVIGKLARLPARDLVAELGAETQGDVVAALAFVEHIGRAAAKGGLDHRVHVGDVDVVAGQGFAAQADVHFDAVRGRVSANAGRVRVNVEGAEATTTLTIVASTTDATNLSTKDSAIDIFVTLAER